MYISYPYSHILVLIYLHGYLLVFPVILTEIFFLISGTVHSTSVKNKIELKDWRKESLSKALLCKHKDMN